MTQPDEAHREPVDKDVETTIVEGRLILPGVQTLFGFQLSVLYTTTFQEKLASTDQYFHVGSLVLVAVAIAILVFPAAYHRQVNPGVVSRRFARLATRAMLVALALVALAMTLTMYVILDVVFRTTALSAAGALFVLAVFVGLWFVFPRHARGRRTHREVVAETAAAPSADRG